MKSSDLWLAINPNMRDLDVAISREVRNIQEETLGCIVDEEGTVNSKPDSASITKAGPNFF
jgi:hypothetical protein